MKYRNAKYNEYGTVDCEIEHPVYGWIPCTVSPDDEETKDIFEEAKLKAQKYVKPVKTDAELFDEFKRLSKVKVQRHLDNMAKQLKYDSIDSIAKYLRPTSPFYDECVSLGDWCDSVWEYYFALLSDIQTDKKAQPTIEQLISGLPAYNGVSA